MKWKSKSKAEPTPDIKPNGVIDVHKKDTQKALEEAKQAKKHLLDVLDENHFTLKIYLAIGGRNGKQQWK